MLEKILLENSLSEKTFCGVIFLTVSEVVASNENARNFPLPWSYIKVFAMMDFCGRFLRDISTEKVTNFVSIGFAKKCDGNFRPIPQNTAGLLLFASI